MKSLSCIILLLGLLTSPLFSQKNINREIKIVQIDSITLPGLSWFGHWMIQKKMTPYLQLIMAPAPYTNSI